MKKQAIWIIILLMSVALLGIILLQAYWINWSLQLEEKRFDKDVQTALSRVAEKVERYEEVEKSLEALLILPSMEEKLSSRLGIAFNESEATLPPAEFFIQENINLDSLIGLNNFLDLLQRQDTCNCAECVKERNLRSQRFMNYWQQRKVKQFVTPPPIEERIKLPLIDKIMRQELSILGIDTRLEYGVFSYLKNTFVIKDGHFVVEEEGQLKASQASELSKDQLLSSPYFVRLFPGDLRPPGVLMLHFPSKARVLWKAGWKPMVASVIFTGIILFCFAYTIHVIFRQKKLSEMKTDFINNMTHEFKTPIATISLAVDSINNPVVAGNPKSLHRFADIIKQENKRMHEQVEKVLQIAQIDRHNPQISKTKSDVHQLILSAVANVNLQVEKKNGRIHTTFNAENPIVEADNTHLSNIIYNLLDNANKYSPETPDILVLTENTPKGIIIKVKDKGIGMAKEARKYIFDKFYRVHTGDLHDVKGFGLGLSYVKAMVEAHGGTIEVKSEPGKGSVFSVFLPFH